MQTLTRTYMVIIEDHDYDNNGLNHKFNETSTSIANVFSRPKEALFCHLLLLPKKLIASLDVHIREE